MTEKTLNSQQKKALELACAAALKGDEYFGLFGAGGTGKTFCANVIVNELRPNCKTLYLAPTNSALNTLKVSTNDPKGTFKTLHSLTEKKPGYSNRGKREFTGRADTTKNNSPLIECDLVVVDEISMIDSKITEEFIELIKEYNARRVSYGRVPLFVIGLGEAYQHRPVGEKTSSFIEFLVKNYSTYTLTMGMRQDGDNPIVPIIAESRKAVIDKEPNYDPRWNHRENETAMVNGKMAGYWLFTDQDKGMRQVTRLFKKMAQGGDWTLGKFVCWKNSTVDFVNKQIRSAIWGDAATIDYIPGDLICCREAIKEKQTDIHSGLTRNVTVLFSGDELIVLDAQASQETFKWVEFSATEAGNIQYVAEHVEHYNTWNITAKLRFEVDDEDARIYDLTVLALDSIEHYTEVNKKICKVACAVKDAQKVRKERIAEGKRFIKTSLENVPEHRITLVESICNEFGSYWTTYYSHDQLFNLLRHAYAVTSHHVQGMTFLTIFFDPDEQNSNKFCRDTANRLRYVTMSRARENVVLVSLPLTYTDGRESKESKRDTISKTANGKKTVLTQSEKDEKMFQMLEKF